MLLRLLALVLASLALLMGLALGWGLPFGTALSRMNPRLIPGIQGLAGGELWAKFWHSLAVPALETPAWIVPAGLAMLLYVVALLRPGRG